jgi:hypothetical protein
MSRTPRRVVILVALAATTGIVLALVDGAPDPGVAVRSYAAVVGGLAAVSAASWLRRDRRGWSGAGAARSGTEPEGDVLDPAAAAWQELERALRFGATTIGDFRLLVQPRLRALAFARLKRHGVSLSDAKGAEALLGEGFHLVDPRTVMPADRLAPGVPTAEIEPLVTALEEL